MLVGIAVAFPSSHSPHYTACAFGLERQSRVIAGIALGLLGYKPSLAVPAIAVVALAGEGAIASLALAVVNVRGALAGITDRRDRCRATVWRAAVDARTRARARLPTPLSWLPLGPSGFLFSRCKVLAWLMPCPADSAVCGAAFTWRRRTDPLERMAALGLAIALAAPHLYFYDLLILAPRIPALGERNHLSTSEDTGWPSRTSAHCSARLSSSRTCR